MTQPVRSLSHSRFTTSQTAKCQLFTLSSFHLLHKTISLPKTPHQHKTIHPSKMPPPPHEPREEHYVTDLSIFSVLDVPKSRTSPTQPMTFKTPTPATIVPIPAPSTQEVQSFKQQYNTTRTPEEHRAHWDMRSSESPFI